MIIRIATIYFFNHGNPINPMNHGSNLFCNFFKFVNNPGLRSFVKLKQMRVKVNISPAQ